MPGSLPGIGAEDLGALAALVALGFLIGSIPFGLLVGRTFFRSDIRTSGSGNIGAANALRTYGRTAGAAVLVLDALKGAVAVGLAVLVAQRFAHVPQQTLAAVPAAVPVLVPLRYFVPLAGLAAIVGHCYSPWLRFKGGKGVATYLGATLALSPLAGLAFVLAWAASGVPSGYASLGSLAATVVAGAALVVVRHGEWPAFAYALGASLIIFWRHRQNLERLRNGSETKTNVFKR